VFAALLSIASFDFFFVPPFYTFAVYDVRYLLTFAVMLGIALVISALTLRIRAQAETARERERHTAALYAMSRELSATRGRSTLALAAERQIGATFDAAVQILLPDAAGRIEIPVGVPPAFPIDEKERSVAQWAFERGRPAGAGTDTLPAAQAMYRPLAGSAGTVGVVGLRPDDREAGIKRLQEPATQRLLEALTGQAALALERVLLTERAQREQVEAEAERLRTALLSSLSHDMRTPLGAITGAASSLLEDRGALSEAQRRDLLKAILDESQRMNRLIGNLLDMIRVETGALEVQRDWQPLEEIVGVALIRLEERLKGHPVAVRLPPDLPLLWADGLLLEQVFVNLLENAAKYTPQGTPIEVFAATADGEIVVDVADRGPGIPARARRVGHRVWVDFATPLDARDFADVEELHERLAALHQELILELAESLEDPRRTGAWEQGATARAWIALHQERKPSPDSGEPTAGTPARAEGSRGPETSLAVGADTWSTETAARERR
jgi:two-component system sensor histidine kinase KdpD